MSRYIYETKTVNSGRSYKYCSACGKDISPGESSITVVCFCDEFYNETVCNDKCYAKFAEDFDKNTEEDDEEVD